MKEGLEKVKELLNALKACDKNSEYSQGYVNTILSKFKELGNNRKCKTCETELPVQCGECIEREILDIYHNNPKVRGMYKFINIMDDNS